MDNVSLSDARLLKLPRYFTGQPCMRWHISERITMDRKCVMCADVYTKAWRQANPERVKAMKSESQKRNRKSANARSRKYVERNRGYAYARMNAWAKAHPEIGAAKAARYLAAKLRQMPKWADHDAINMIYRAADVCRKSGFDAHVDHIVPLQGVAVRGLHVHNNLQIITANRNIVKSNQFSV